MDLDTYLWKHRMTQRDFAARIGLTRARISNIVQKSVGTSLLTALKIVIATKGEVNLEELLREEDRKSLQIFKNEMKEYPKTQKNPLGYET